MNPAIITLKSFGDFVIACSASKRVQSSKCMNAPTVVAGEHVRNLASALGVDRAIQFIGDDSWSDFPAARAKALKQPPRGPKSKKLLNISLLLSRYEHSRINSRFDADYLNHP